MAIAFCLGSCLLLSAAFAIPTGTARIALLCLGIFIVIGTNGPSMAMVANLTHHSVHSSAFATLTIANNLLGIALGPLVIGKISDHVGLHDAFQLMPFMSILSAAVFFYAKRHYHSDIIRLTEQGLLPPSAPQQNKLDS